MGICRLLIFSYLMKCKPRTSCFLSQTALSGDFGGLGEGLWGHCGPSKLNKNITSSLTVSPGYHGCRHPHVCRAISAIDKPISSRPRLAIVARSMLTFVRRTPPLSSFMLIMLFLALRRNSCRPKSQCPLHVRPVPAAVTPGIVYLEQQNDRMDRRDRGGSS